MATLARLAIGVVIMGALLWLVGCTLAPASQCWICAPLQRPPPASPLEMRIVPVWYTLPLYGILRAATFNIGPLSAKSVGIVLAGAAFLARLSWRFSIGRARQRGRFWLCSPCRPS